MRQNSAGSGALFPGMLSVLVALYVLAPAWGCDRKVVGQDGGQLAALDVIVEHGDVSVPADVAAEICNRSTRDAVFLDGCDPFSLQLADGPDWVEMGPMRRCFVEGPATVLQPGECLERSVSIMDPGVWRFVARYATDCTPGEPLSRAGCSDRLVTIHSGAVRVPASD